MINETIRNMTFDEERSLYHLQNAEVIECVFAGPADGESALKEARNVTVRDCRFSLRYPLWHTESFRLIHSTMDVLTRAPIWYARDGLIDSCTISGVKCLRECDRMEIRHSTIRSEEFGWRCRGLKIEDTDLESQYLFFEASDAEIRNLRMKGKYSFQYTENITICDSNLDTKDAFWHAKNVTVKNSVIKGEYLAWYSDGLTLIDCKIIGTQPLCYVKNLTLINCTMEDTDLSFEYSDVNADIRGHIVSVKNPRSGEITADSIGEVIFEDSVFTTECNVHIRTPV